MSVEFVKVLSLSLLLCVGGGWWTGLISQRGIREWYPRLIKAPGTPPNSVFPVVWTTLYVFMAIALSLLWTNRSGQRKRKALVLFAVQLLLNFSWSYLFFYFYRVDLALLDILLLWIAIYLTAVSFRKHTLWGSRLLLPYLVWVTYATYLNLFIWIYN